MSIRFRRFDPPSRPGLRQSGSWATPDHLFVAHWSHSGNNTDRGTRIILTDYRSGARLTRGAYHSMRELKAAMEAALARQDEGMPEGVWDVPASLTPRYQQTREERAEKKHAQESERDRRLLARGKRIVKRFSLPSGAD